LEARQCWCQRMRVLRLSRVPPSTYSMPLHVSPDGCLLPSALRPCAGKGKRHVRSLLSALSETLKAFPLLTEFVIRLLLGSVNRRWMSTGDKLGQEKRPARSSCCLHVHHAARLPTAADRRLCVTCRGSAAPAPLLRARTDLFNLQSHLTSALPMQVPHAEVPAGPTPRWQPPGWVGGAPHTSAAQTCSSLLQHPRCSSVRLESSGRFAVCRASARPTVAAGRWPPAGSSSG